MADVLAGVRVIAILRVDSADSAVRAGVELALAGVPAVEVTLTTPDAVTAIERLRSTVDCPVGAGSVRRPTDVVLAAEAGAQFLVTPTTRLDMLAEATLVGLPVVCGALTPTEIDTAWLGGAAYVKLFPARQVGPGYLREVRAPLPDVRLVPTGGVTAESVAEWAAAGAVAVGVGSALADPRLVAAGDWAALADRARAFMRAAEEAWPR